MKSPSVSTWIVGIGLLVSLCVVSPAAWAQAKGEKTFQATLTDAQGVETEVRNVIFYWEEKISEIAFVPHELKQIPVKRGTTTVNVKFDTIKVIDVKPGADAKTLPTLMVTLTNGKTGEFALAIDGKFKGDSDFGEVELPASGLKKIAFK
jgi:hypothetical protein